MIDSVNGTRRTLRSRLHTSPALTSCSAHHMRSAAMTSPSAAVQPKRCDPLLLGDAEIDEVEEFVNEVLEVWSL